MMVGFGLVVAAMVVIVGATAFGYAVLELRAYNAEMAGEGHRKEVTAA